MPVDTALLNITSRPLKVFDDVFGEHREGETKPAILTEAALVQISRNKP